MKRLIIVMALFLAVTSIPKPAVADQVTWCGGSYISYFVLDGLVKGNSIVLAKYFDGMKHFSDGTVNRRRQSELGADVVFGTCDIWSFAAENGLSFGSHLGGEFWEVEKAGTRVGTVWIDYKLPMASGGGISVQQTYQCSVDKYGFGGWFANAGAFHTGLSRDAMNDVDDNVKEKEWFSRARNVLARVTEKHMARSECDLVEDTGAWLSKYGDSYAVEYLVLDPAYGLELRMNKE